MRFLTLPIITLLLCSCVSTKKYQQIENRYQQSLKQNNKLRNENSLAIVERKRLQDSIQTLFMEIDSLKAIIDFYRIQGWRSRVESKNNPEANKRIETAVFAPETIQKAEAASSASFLNQQEQEFLYLLNLCRLEPAKFSQHYLKDLHATPASKRTSYENSLLKDLSLLKPLPAVKANQKLFELAQCHARNSGESGKIGHERKGYTDECRKGWFAEVCSYGNLDVLGHLINLLIDESVPSLGHRMILLGKYENGGIAIWPHKIWGSNLVGDFN